MYTDMFKILQEPIKIRNILRKVSFLMVSLLLLGCASQKSIIRFNAADANPGSNSGQPAQKVDNLIAEKPIAVPLSQPVEVEKEVTPVKEAVSAIEQTTVSNAEPVPEKVSITPTKLNEKNWIIQNLIMQQCQFAPTRKPPRKLPNGIKSA